MKFPESFTHFIGKPKDEVEYYFSLVLERDGASAAAWSMNPKNQLEIASVAHGVLKDDTWDTRISVADQLLSAAEEKVRPTHPITKTVFGMPITYLTSDGNILTDIRVQLKKLSKLLELQAVGFVPLTQAIALSLKIDEGIPASVILVHCTKETITVSLYRIGICVREQTLNVEESATVSLEKFLTDGTDADVLPSRILLYGADLEVLEHVRGLFLKHQWPTKANFLHFPKIEILTHEDVLRAVSLAGSSELSTTLGEEDQRSDDSVGSTVVAQPTRTTPEEVVDENVQETFQPMHVSQEENEDIENVQVVGAKDLGFGSEDVVERDEDEESISMGDQDSLESEGSTPVRKPISFFKNFAFTRPSFSLPSFPRRFTITGSQKIISVIIGCIGVVLLLGLLYYFVPRAVVTVYVLPTTLSETATITVDPVSTVVDPATKTIPGQTQELSLSAQKTSAVTGKKKVGDPSKGTVTFYNKITSERTLKKGTVLTAKGISFGLDEEVKIASASESIGSITFGKNNALITAIDIGQEGNVAAGTEFVVKDISSSSLLARNDVALTGGVSREVTVVSRADYDGALKTLTDEIVTKAKAQLLSEAGGNRLIEQTIKTKVSQKLFDKELDQEAKELSGTVTASVSGIVIRDEDVKSLLLSLVTPKLPAGYSFTGGKTDVTIAQAQVKKDGKITVSATVSAVALPLFPIEDVQKKLAGKSISQALSLLKGMTGVGAVDYRFIFSPTKSRLPINKANIHLSVAVQ